MEPRLDPIGLLVHSVDVEDMDPALGSDREVLDLLVVVRGVAHGLHGHVLVQLQQRHHIDQHCKHR
eukprot:1285657-Rhodomonas_salina.4